MGEVWVGRHVTATAMIRSLSLCSGSHQSQLEADLIFLGLLSGRAGGIYESIEVPSCVRVDPASGPRVLFSQENRGGVRPAVAG